MGRLASQFKSKISLADVGTHDKTHSDAWREAYLTMAPLTVKALPILSKLNVSKEQTDVDDQQVASLLPLLKESFLEGKVVVDGELVDAVAEDLEDLPLSVMNQVITAVVGDPDPKS